MLVHDHARGGATLDVIRNEECPQELRDAIFRNRRIIEWHRARDFQLVGLKLIAEQLLLGCPVYRDRRSLPLYVPGEIDAQRLAFRKPILLYASPHNPGAGAIALRLAGATKRLTIVDQPAPADGDGLATGATHFLLYLTSQTFVGDMGEALAQEVRRSRAAGFGEKIVMLHENDFDDDGCEFGRRAEKGHLSNRCRPHFPSASHLADLRLCPCLQVLRDHSTRPDQRWAIRNARACILPWCILACERGAGCQSARCNICCRQQSRRVHARSSVAVPWDARRTRGRTISSVF